MLAAQKLKYNGLAAANRAAALKATLVGKSVMKSARLTPAAKAALKRPAAADSELAADSQRGTAQMLAAQKPALKRPAAADSELAADSQHAQTLQEKLQTLMKSAGLKPAGSAKPALKRPAAATSQRATERAAFLGAATSALLHPKRRPAAADSEPAAKAAALKRAAKPAALKRPAAADSAESATLKRPATLKLKRPAVTADSERDAGEEAAESERDCAFQPDGAEPDSEPKSDAADSESEEAAEPHASGFAHSFGDSKNLWVSTKAEQLYGECGRTKQQAQLEANDMWKFSLERRLLVNTMTPSERSKRRLKHPEEM
jgi:hypothetical protein